MSPLDRTLTLRLDGQSGTEVETAVKLRAEDLRVSALEFINRHLVVSVDQMLRLQRERDEK